MYVDKTTAAERLIIGQVVDPAITNVKRARRLLMKVLGDFFEDREQKAIDRNDAEDIGDILIAVNDALWMAEVDYCVAMGQSDEVPGGDSYYEGAKQALLVRDVGRLREKLHYEDTEPYTEMDDEKALPILREIAKKKGMVV